jgi:phosphoribosyl 1,2-cyclic phosphodiesterase
MQITFWGVRALVPSPGQETTVTGGNTLCLTVQGTGGESLAIDAGTGITPWGRSLLAGPFGKGQGELDLFITHPHYDHIQGFPFFVPAFIPGNTIRLYGSNYCKRTMEQVLESQMNPIFSPIQSLKNLNSNLIFPEVGPGGVVTGRHDRGGDDPTVGVRRLRPKTVAKWIVSDSTCRQPWARIHFYLPAKRVTDCSPRLGHDRSIGRGPTVGSIQKKEIACSLEAAPCKEFRRYSWT